MVHCPVCLRKLPAECACNEPPEEKVRRWARLAAREAELIAMVGSGFKPTVKAYLIEKCADEGVPEAKLTPVPCEVQVKQKGPFDVSIVAQINAKRKASGVLAVLHDTNGEQLFRRMVLIDVNPGDAVFVTWNLGFG